MNLVVEELYKEYRYLFRKSKEVLKGVNFQIEEGQVYALIGQNGAGKTTTIKCILKYIRMDRGNIKFGIDKIEYLMGQNKVGYLPENLNFPGVISLREFLSDLCLLRGMNKNLAEDRINRLVYEFNLEQVLDKSIDKFSKGMKKKVGFIQAIINEPKIIILDEPTDGLDPISRRKVLYNIRQIANEGNIVLITSHILSDLSIISDKVGLINDGKIISQIKPKDYFHKEVPKISFEIHRGYSIENKTLDLEKSSQIVIDNIDKCIIKEVFIDRFDLEQWYYDELLQRGIENVESI